MGQNFNGKKLAEKPIKLRLLYVGEHKIGKTTAASEFPDPFVLSMKMEDGHKVLLGKDIDGYICDDWDDVSRVVTKVVETRNHGYRTFVFDGVSFASVMLENALYEKYPEVKDPRQIWGMFGLQVSALIETLHKFNGHVIYTGHLRHIEQESGKGRDKTVKVSDEFLFPGKFGKLIPAAVDGVIGITKEYSVASKRWTRQTHFENYKHMQLGTRFRGLPSYIEHAPGEFFPKLDKAFKKLGIVLHGGQFDEASQDAPLELAQGVS